MTHSIAKNKDNDTVTKVAVNNECKDDSLSSSILVIPSDEVMQTNDYGHPIIINRTTSPIIIYLSRAGFLFNKQCLHPNEAMAVKRSGKLFSLPYDIHAEIGDEQCLPDKLKGLKTFVTANAVPVAFCAGLLATALSAGVLTGAGAALTPLVSGLVVNGVVIDSAAIAAGFNTAGGVKMVVEKLVKEKEEHFFVKETNIKAHNNGTKMFVIYGGLDTPLSIKKIEKTKDQQKEKEYVTVFKKPIN